MAASPSVTAQDALERLRVGNRRFVMRGDGPDDRSAPLPRFEAAAEQRPFAIILGCSDSRVPIEIVFDQGVGDLFVVRVAGNIAASSQIGSIELAAAQFGTRLVVVLGHTKCGAVLATLQEMEEPTESQSPHLRSIVDRVRPSVELARQGEARPDRDELVRRAVRANVEASVKQLQHDSETLAGLVRGDGLMVVGAEYCLETGGVEFLGEG